MLLQEPNEWRLRDISLSDALTFIAFSFSFLFLSFSFFYYPLNEMFSNFCLYDSFIFFIFEEEIKTKNNSTQYPNSKINLSCQR